ncbi:MAG: type II toxin-antitoxin system VapC family toxin [Chloroflexi bacterium]|nr:type II toxin-antitoxin system VapC family toxin [Chloroflexota bacterium]
MVSNYVLDASALLSLLNSEDGSDLVLVFLPHSVISTVNLAEVVTRLSILGMPEGENREALTLLGLEIIPFDEEQAFRAGLLSAYTQPLGLSLGDRACLALALTTQSIALTADRVWKDLDIGVAISLIR